MSLEGDWDAYMLTLDPAKAARRIESEIRKATINNCVYVLGLIRKEIRGRKYAPNSPLTKILKGSGMPLIDHADLVKYLAYDLETSFSAYVGAKKSDGTYNIAKIVHDGATIRVTPKMRKWIAISMAKAKGRGRKVPKSREFTGGGKDFFVIPARPFLTRIMQRKMVQNRIRKRWAYAFEVAMTPTT